MVSLKSATATLLGVALLTAPLPCGAVDLSVKANGGNTTTSTMYGLMHEDINNSGDGGMYAELIRNRAFQGSAKYPVSLDAWSPVGSATLSLKQLTQPLSSALPTSMNVATTAKKGKVGFANSGYWGMDVKVQKYTGSFYVRGAYEGKFTASLQSNLTGQVFGSVDVESESVSNGWTQHNFTLIPFKNAPNSNNSLVITFDAAGVQGGSLDFNLISLFPPTYKNRANGMRVDIMEALAELKPKFLRLPGGNMLEGNTLPTFWKWNETIGPLKDRPGFPGVWGYEQTNGLGIIEYMHWCDDLGLEPIVAVWSGVALDGSYLPQSRIQEAVQFALDEIEFLTGDAKTTRWGAVRASLGYPAPWKIKYVELGNEDWLAGAPAAYEAYKQYRLPALVSAFQKNYPDIQLIASPSIFDNITIPAGVAGDYHPYLTPDEFVANYNKFDHISKQNLTLIGECASVHPNGGTAWNGNLMPYPWWGGSVGEAIFLIGAERNADRLIGATYAPGMRNMNRWQWSVTQIQLAADPKLTTRSTSFYTWKLLGNTPLAKTLPVTAATAGNNSLYYVAGVSDAGTGVFKAAVYNSTAPVPVNVQFEGVDKNTQATLTVLTGPADPYGYNDPFTQKNVVKETVTTVKADKDGGFGFSLPALSVAVLEVDDNGRR
ncbi:glycoside hydrolase superfamily [Diplogelasinospora grovesii]|uniref:non-reducing end alpha-L-arabinofuranosidase n=1 Tax=Diplogelasinospora grovesii TaxID=303347 RepID=A0AAN6RYW3_9PEZI|nr:glycoside hydrolase superfamily [Diplogelasinospora grovesii]